ALDGSSAAPADAGAPKGGLQTTSAKPINARKIVKGCRRKTKERGCIPEFSGLARAESNSRERAGNLGAPLPGGNRSVMAERSVYAAGMPRYLGRLQRKRCAPPPLTGYARRTMFLALWVQRGRLSRIRRRPPQMWIMNYRLL